MKTRALLFALVMAACGPVDITVVNVPDGGEPAAQGAPCASNTACLAGQFCQKSACSDSLGHCEQRPVLCPSDGPPLCGCDGITYWNDCLRKRAGIAAVSSDRMQCSNPRTCDLSTPCPTGTYCARLIKPFECGNNVLGACWDLPDGECTGPMPKFAACGFTTPCVDVCTAIRTELPRAEMRGPGTCQ